VLAGQITERQLINLLENARALCSDRKFVELGHRHGLQLSSLFPHELADSKLEKVSRLVRFRMDGLTPDLGPAKLSAGDPNPVSKEGRSAQIPGKEKQSADWSLEDFLPHQTPPSKDRELEI
jgi:hypothetical protein